MTMQNIYRFVVAHVLTFFFCVVTLFVIILKFLRNPFKSPLAQKLRLEPPSRIKDPKYGLHKYIKVNNIKLHYVESGDPTKPLMLFLHGFPEFWYSWRHQIVEFNKNYWCIAVDMRGYGDSERPEDVNAYKIEILIDDVRDLIRQLGDKKCILVSHDWGGLIAIRYRDLYPETLSACVLLASISREAWMHELWNTWSQMFKSWYVFMFQAPYVGENLMLLSDMAMYEQSMLTKGKEGTDEQDIECYKFWFGKPSAFTCPINYYRANLVYSVPEKFHKEDVPLLVAHGEKDFFLNHSMLDLMKKSYATIETTIVKDVGHFMQQEDPDKINKLIKDFLNKNSL